jgi:hypothetical protein
MLTEITSITTVASRPNARSHPFTANLTMMSGRHAIFIMTVIGGTATTRFCTALQ